MAQDTVHIQNINMLYLTNYGNNTILPNIAFMIEGYKLAPITCLYSMSLYVCDCIGLHKYM